MSTYHSLSLSPLSFLRQVLFFAARSVPSFVSGCVNVQKTKRARDRDRDRERERERAQQKQKDGEK